MLGRLMWLVATRQFGTKTIRILEWTIRTVDCSYPPGLFVLWIIRTVLSNLTHIN